MLSEIETNLEDIANVEGLVSTALMYVEIPAQIRQVVYGRYALLPLDPCKTTNGAK